ncbi:MAG: dihydroorotate dehydrogenase [Betaproteobacteria bacterium HGW-Betaproteobacteria-10]|nr:MAG: dihydroorotate dehydrogenase [Betaproteobacteria bacterium HGW-Betaproteobacteria-10]
MSALIVGGDRVGPYRDFLASQGFGPVRHWCGRKPGACHRIIPVDTRVIVVMVDQINHGLARKIRKVAEEMAVPVVFSKRSVGQLGSALALVARP